jgi:ABC-type polysaccharide/polyol phosphate export permease
MELSLTSGTSPAGGLSGIRHAWELLYLLTRRDLKLRYQDTALGFFWTAAKPLLFGLVIWFALRKVLDVETGEVAYHIFLLSALLPWTWFQTSLLLSTPLIAGNGALIKKVPFPVYVLPLATIANNLIHFLLSIPVLILFLVIDGRAPGPEWLLGIPLLLIIQLALMMGAALLLSALDVYFRDLEHLIEVVLNLLFYVTPILYPLSLVPGPYDDLLRLNPLAPLIEAWRDLFVSSDLPGAGLWPTLVITAVIVAAGSWAFNKLRLTFADYL